MTERNIKEMFKMMDTCISAVDNLRTEMRLGFDSINGELIGIKGDICDLKTDVAQLKTDVAQLKTDVAQLKTDVAQLKTDVAGMNKRMDEFAEKQDRFELHLRRNNRALDKVAGHWMRTDIQIGKLEDAMISEPL